MVEPDDLRDCDWTDLEGCHGLEVVGLVEGTDDWTAEHELICSGWSRAQDGSGNRQQGILMGVPDVVRLPYPLFQCYANQGNNALQPAAALISPAKSSSLRGVK